MDRKFDTVGVMIDMSRNAVMSIEGLGRLLPILADLGYNALMLYTEDTYEVEGEPYFGYMRGRYSVSDMQKIDDMASELGIEVIPCIQTLGHLTQISRWNVFDMDTDDILMVGSPRTYELIDKMLTTLKKCFRSRRIHIGMDEAHTLGRGRYLDENGYEKQSDIMRKHLIRVTKIAENHGYEPMIWSDMFFRGWNGGYYAERSEIPEDYRAALPQSVTPVYWDYYMRDEQRYDDMLYNHRQLSPNTWFAGGIWTWLGFAPANIHSILTMTPAIRMCEKHGVRNLFFTLWGDDGGECSRFAVLPALYHISRLVAGETDESAIKHGFEEKFGIPYDTFTLLDLPNEVGRQDSPWAICPAKYMFYSDPLMGFLDNQVEDDGNKIYRDYASRLGASADRAGEYGYLFLEMQKLCEILSHKYELGVKLRSAYKQGDREEISNLLEDVDAIIDLIPEFHELFKHSWERENRRAGFEVQAHRIGGVLLRMKDVRRILSDYLEGVIDSIPELEEDILPYCGRPHGRSLYYNDHRCNISAGVVAFGFA